MKEKSQRTFGLLLVVIMNEGRIAYCKYYGFTK